MEEVRRAVMGDRVIGRVRGRSRPPKKQVERIREESSKMDREKAKRVRKWK